MDLGLVSNLPVAASAVGGMSAHIPQLWEEFLLGILALAFLSWAGVVWQASRSLGAKLDVMRSEFHEHNLSVEHRITAMEVLVQQLKGIVDELEQQNQGVKS